MLQQSKCRKKYKWRHQPNNGISRECWERRRISRSWNILSGVIEDGALATTNDRITPTMTGHSNWLLKCVTMVYSYEEDKKKYIDIISLYTRRRPSIDLEIVDKHILDIIEWMKCFFFFFYSSLLLIFLESVFFPFYQRECLAKKFHSIKKLFFFCLFAACLALGDTEKKKKK